MLKGFFFYLVIFCIEVVIFWLLSVALVQHEWAISERDEWMIGKEIIEREYNLLKYDVRFFAFRTS